MKSKRKPVRKTQKLGTQNTNNRKKIMGLSQMIQQLIGELQARFQEITGLFQVTEGVLTLLVKNALGENMTEEEWEQLRSFLPEKAPEAQLGLPLEAPASESGPHPVVE